MPPGCRSVAKPRRYGRRADALRLHDLADDPACRHDVSDAHPDVVAVLWDLTAEDVLTYDTLAGYFRPAVPCLVH